MTERNNQPKPKQMGTYGIHALMQAVPRCPKCEAHTLADDCFCQECGTKLTQHTFSLPNAEKSSSLGARSGLNLSLAVLLLTFVVTTTWWWIDRQKDQSSLSSRKTLAEVKACIHANRLNQAISTLESMSVERGGNLTADGNALLDEALYMRSRQFAGQHHYARALSDLLRISHAYKDYPAVAERIKRYSRLSDEIRAPARARLNPDATGITHKSLRHRHSNPQAQVTTSSPSNDERRSVSTTSSIASSGARVPNPHSYSEDDVRRYNRELAAYFSESDTGRVTSTRAREPLSFKEWLDSGKPAL